MDNPTVVYTGCDRAAAQLARLWLEKHGVRAAVKGEGGRGLLSVIGRLLYLSIRYRGWVYGGPLGIGLDVLVDQADAARAEALVAEFEKRNRPANGPAESYDPADFVRVVCDACDKQAFFHVSKRGQVEQCPHCTEYLDIE